MEGMKEANLLRKIMEVRRWDISVFRPLIYLDFLNKRLGEKNHLFFVRLLK